MERFEYSSLILAPVEKVFGFHERADAIQLLTPAIMRPRVTRLRGSGLEAGVELIVTTLAGPWHARHTAYEKNRLFVDEMVAGPMREWRHEHRFTAEGPHTRLTDSIRFVPKGPAFLVKLGLQGLFWFRHRVTKRWCEVV